MFFILFTESIATKEYSDFYFHDFSDKKEIDASYVFRFSKGPLLTHSIVIKVDMLENWKY